MQKLNDLLSEYASSHQNPSNIIIHKLCVPAIMFSFIGLLKLVSFSLGPLELNLAYVVMTLSMLYYLFLSFKYSAFMLVIFSVLYWMTSFFDSLEKSYLLYLAIFIISWVFQFVGHKIEGKKPSFLTDIFFLLIGPLWVVKKLFKLKD